MVEAFGSGHGGGILAADEELTRFTRLAVDREIRMTEESLLPGPGPESSPPGR